MYICRVLFDSVLTACLDGSQDALQEGEEALQNKFLSQVSLSLEGGWQPTAFRVGTNDILYKQTKIRTYVQLKLYKRRLTRMVKAKSRKHC